MADPLTIERVVTALRGTRPVSIALGELRDYLSARRTCFRFETIPWSGITFAKLGLAGCAGWDEWPVALANAWQAWPTQVRRVAVAYADNQLAQSPHWEDVLRVAVESGVRVLLIDTADKRAGGLLDWFSLVELAAIRDRVHAAGLELALAGSLTIQHVGQLAEAVRPDILAVRTAACGGERTASIRSEAVAELQRVILDAGSSRIETLE